MVRPYYQPGLRFYRSGRAFSGTRIRRFYATPQRRFVQPGRAIAVGGVGKHHGRNRSTFARIPAIFLGSGADAIEVDAYIDSIDASAPLESVSACTASSCLFGAMSMANDGAWGGAWSYADADAARTAAIANCRARTKESCGGIFVASGTAWIAGLQCERRTPRLYWHWGVMALGDDLAAALRNVYRSVLINGFYHVSECAFVAAIAADGSHLQYMQQE